MSGRTRMTWLVTLVLLLWAFAAWVTVGASANLFSLGLLKQAGVATETVVAAVQQERRATAIALGSGQTGDLAAMRADTDRAAAAWRDVIAGRTMRLFASREMASRFDTFAAQMDGIGGLRDGIDARSTDRAAALQRYTAVVESGFSVYASMSSLDDPDFARHSGALIRLSYAREVMSRQDALLAGALADGRLDGGDLRLFTELAGARRLLYQRTTAEIAPADADMLRDALNGTAMSELRRMEDTIITHTRPGARPPVATQGWDTAVTDATGAMRAVELTAADNLVRRATPIIVTVVGQLLGAGILGLVAVVIALRTTRTFIRQLISLRDAAHELATHRLPDVVQQLSSGKAVDPAAHAAAITPPGPRISEIAQLAAAFGLVQEQAVQAAVAQAALRTKVRDIFLTLARRNQTLVRRQLKVLDAAERRITDDDQTIKDLFLLDHLATRMRRSAESLIVLAGAPAGHRWNQPIPVIDIMRGAVAEVEEYQRVQVQPCEAAAVDGRVAGEMIHLLAELIENGLKFSPPFAHVTVSGKRVHHGYVIETEDRGLGMDADILDTANRLLSAPPDFDRVDPAHLGHCVVAKLAHNHGVKVSIRPSPYGGIHAIILIPADALTFDEVQPPQQPTTRRGRAPLNPQPEPATDTNGRHAAPPPPPGPAPDLPQRQRQAHLPAALRDEQPTETGSAAVPPPRSPEDTKARMNAMRQGIQRGRETAPDQPEGPR